MNGASRTSGAVLLLLLGSATARAQAPAQTGAKPAPSAAAAPSTDPVGFGAAPSGGATTESPQANEPAAPEPGTQADAPTEPQQQVSPEPEPEPEPEPAESVPSPGPRVRWVGSGESPGEASPDSNDDAERESTSEEPGAWSFEGGHFVLSIERAVNLLSWSETNESSTTTSGVSESLELETSGVDVAFLGAGGATRTPFGLPRVAFDGVLDVGLTLGGSLSYMVTSGERKSQRSEGSSVSTSQDLPTQTTFILAPRLGVLLRQSPTLGIWLRGGISHVVVTSEVEQAELNAKAESSVSLWNVTLDPQLVIVAAPRVGILLGGLLEIGLPGTSELTLSDSGQTQSVESDDSASAYGITAGLAGIF